MLSEKFLEQTRGLTPLPVDIDISGTLECVDKMKGGLLSATFSQQIRPLSAFSNTLQTLIKFTEDKSLSSAQMPFREVAILAVIYDNGDASAIWHTSDLPNHIAADAYNEAVEASGVLDNIETGNMPRDIIHIHTHPAPEFSGSSENSLLINPSDYTFYKHMANFFSGFAGRDYAVLGIVRPVGSRCGDVGICTEALPDPVNVTSPLNAGKLSRISRALDKLRPKTHAP